MSLLLAFADTPFPLGPGRWSAVVLVLLLGGALALLVRITEPRKRGQEIRCAMCRGLACALLAGAVVAELQRVAAGIWSVQESLPLHLCDIAVFVTAATLWIAARPADTQRRQSTRPGSAGAAPSPSAAQRLFELAFVWGVGGTSQAVLTPDIDDTVLTSECVRYFALHGGILVGILVLTFGLRFRLIPGAPRRVWLTTLVLAGVVLGIDALLGANYMYLMGPPQHPSIIDLLGRWPWSLLGLAALATVLIYLCYAPFWLARVLRSKAGPPRGAPAKPDATP